MIDMLRLYIICFIYCLVISPPVKAENAGIYMAINALAGVDEYENVIKRRIEIDWYGAEVQYGMYGPWSYMICTM